MTGPLAQQFATLRSFRDFIPDWNDGPTGFPEEFDAALSVIERHVQDMEKALRARLSKGHNDTCSALLSEGCACDCGMVETISVLAALSAGGEGSADE